MTLVPHEYISPACHHDFHEYCKGYIVLDDASRTLAKGIGHCKYCGSGCRCDCHREKK